MRNRFALLDRTIHSLCVLVLAMTMATPGLFAQTSDLTSHPGYVDFSQIPFLDPDKLTVEINLGGSLLGILASSLEDEETEFGDLIAKLRSIRVSIFDLEEEDSIQVRDRALEMSQQLIDQGWEAIVRIREEGEAIQILVRHDGERIAGLAAMFVEAGDSAGFINIVGEVDPGQVARLGRQLNIRALEVMEQVNEEDGQ